MIRLIVRKLREDGLTLREMSAEHHTQKELQSRKTQMLTEIYRMLVLNLGQPPKTFDWRYKDKAGKLSEYKKYTPGSFREEALDAFRPDDYIMERKLPGCELLFCPPPYEQLPQAWWKNQQAAAHVIMECAKFAFYFTGTPFRSAP